MSFVNISRFINVTIVSGRGTLYGTLVTKVEEDKKWIDKEVENFEVIVPSQEGEYVWPVDSVFNAMKCQIIGRLFSGVRL